MRSILLPLTDPELDRHAIRQATTLSSAFEGQVTAVLPLTDFASLPVGLRYEGIVGWDQMLEQTREHTEHREKQARQALAELGLSGDRTSDLALHAQYGNDDAVVARAALTHDLVLFTRKSTDVEELPASSLLKTILESSGRPILVVTDELAPDFGRIAVVAWNGSVEAAHAVTAALPLLKRAEQVHVLTFTTSRTDADAADDLLAYLARHGITADAHVLEPELSIGEEVLMEVESLSADLLVMGGYTHSRLRQTLFGGVTHHVLENGRLPLLLAR